MLTNLTCSSVHAGPDSVLSSLMQSLSSAFLFGSGSGGVALVLLLLDGFGVVGDTATYPGV